MGKRVALATSPFHPAKTARSPARLKRIVTCTPIRAGSLYQPGHLGPRDDIGGQDCGLSQLKIKPEDRLGELDDKSPE
jgi:hypothetical protein